ncbi:MAG: hypothetical protein AB7F36_11450 [Reyranellaceae bacterium]
MGRHAYLAAATLDEEAIEKFYEQLETKHRYVGYLIFNVVSEMIDHDMDAPHAATILDGLYVPDADLVDDHPVSPKSLADALRTLAEIWRNDPRMRERLLDNEDMMRRHNWDISHLEEFLRFRNEIADNLEGLARHCDLLDEAGERRVSLVMSA